MLKLEENSFMIHFMEDIVKNFVAGLKKWAKINKISQKDLADIIGKDQTTISNYYRNKTRPTQEYINLWVDHYGLDSEKIIEAGRKELQPTVKKTGEAEYFTKEEAEARFADMEERIKSREGAYVTPQADDKMTTEIFYNSLATQYVDEALEETGVKITATQREKFIKVTKEDMQKTIKQTKVNVKKHLKIFEE